MFKRLPKCILHIIAQYVIPRPVRLKLFINPEKIDWYGLSRNPTAISLLEKNMDKIYWAISKSCGNLPPGKESGQDKLVQFI